MMMADGGYKNVAIVGGGILGMTLANRLSEQGHNVTLYEASKQLGGLAASSHVNGVLWDKFYHVILKSDAYTNRLLEELNLTDGLEWVETRTGFYADGKMHSMSNSLEFLRFPPLGLWGKIRLGFTIWYASRVKNWKRLEGIYVSDWLRKLSGKKTYNKIWLPLLRSKLGEHYKETSASFIWATIQRMYAARRSGLKREMFGYVKGGYDVIVRSYAAKLESQGVEIQTGYSIKQVIRKEDDLRLYFSNGEQRTFDDVILTIPSAIAVNTAPQLAEQEIKMHKEIKYLGVICPSVLLKKSPGGFYVTNIVDEGLPFTGVIEMSAMVDRKLLDGYHLVYLPRYVSSDDPLFDEDEVKIQQVFLEGLMKMFPHIHEDDIEGFSLGKARNVFALSKLNFSRNLPPMKTSVKGLYIINSAHITNGTLNVNETIQLAEQAVNIFQNNEKTEPSVSEYFVGS